MNICIRSTIHRRAISCHLFERQVLLIRTTKIQPDIPVSKFLGLLLYQEHRPSAGDVVLAPRVSCSGRKYGTSAIYFCSFTSYSCLKIFWKVSVSGAPPIGKRFRATSLSIMCSWYEPPILRTIDILILDWFQPKIFSCYLRECYVLLIQNTKYRPAIPSRSRDIGYLFKDN